MNEFIEVKANAKSIWMRKLVHGIGINDADYQTQPRINGKKVKCQFYRKWTGMLERCYSTKLKAKYPTYIGVTVCEEWLTFSVFKAWMEKQKWEDLELDKDIISHGSKHYSPETCCFVPRALNNLLTNSAAARGDCPQGVTIYNATGKYQANCRYNGRLKYLGCFTTPEEAGLAYRTYKHAIVRKIASEQTNPRIMRGLVIHADLILRGIEL